MTAIKKKEIKCGWCRKKFDPGLFSPYGAYCSSQCFYKAVDERSEERERLELERTAEEMGYCNFESGVMEGLWEGEED